MSSTSWVNPDQATPDAGHESPLGEHATYAPGAYAVKLPVFEGPLDLLLHLIRQNEVDITDIPVARIGRQYLDYLEMMRELNLDVAGEYLVMAATLALIKSRMLLPPEPGEDDGEETDPRAELVQRLLEYQRFKEVAEGLGLRRRLGRDVFDPQGLELDSVPEYEREIEVGLFELLEAFRQVLRSADEKDPTVHAVELETEEFTVRERIYAVMELLEQNDSIEFTQIFEQPGQPAGAVPTKPLVVASFLAILELARLFALRIYQGVGDEGAPVGPIRLRKIDDNIDGIGWRERVADLM